MPWTLYRYILAELLKLIVLATTVLILVISFAVAVQPLSEGLLGPATLAKFVLYTMPTVLGFALPFAGAFAATLVFIRLATDNEILAALASGISYQRVLLPVLVLGIAMTAGLFLLSNFVVPSFYKKAERTVQSDLITLMVNQLNRDRPFTGIDGFVIYAESARETDDVPQVERASVQPSKLIQLTGVAAAQLDSEQRIRSEAMAQRASLLLFNDPGSNRSWIRIFLRSGMHYDQAGGTLGQVEDGWSNPIPLDQGLGDRPKFMSYFELRDLGENPQRYGPVRDRMSSLAEALSVRKLQLMIGSALSEGGEPLELVGRLPSEAYRLWAPGLSPTPNGFELRSSGGEPVRVNYRRDGQLVQRLEAESGTLRIELDERAEEPSVRVDLTGVRSQDVQGVGLSTTQGGQQLRRMYWPGPLFQRAEDGQAESANDLSLSQLSQLSSVEALGSSAAVSQATQRVADAMDRLEREILAQLHERAASAVSCCLLLLLGAMLSVWLKNYMALVVYAVSFVLAILTIILISTGENLATSSDSALAVGPIVMWSGNALLAGACGFVYLRIERN